jgi:hypothetical protein
MFAKIAALAVLCIVAMAQGPGSFAGEFKNAEISLQLAGSGGQYTGTLKYQGASLPVRAGEQARSIKSRRGADAGYLGANF